MENRVVTCMKCKKRIDVPLYVSSLTCPGCGEKIILTGGSIIPETDPRVAAEFIEKKHAEALSLLTDDVLFKKGTFTEFSNSDYPAKFKIFYKKLRPSVECINTAYQYTTEFKKKVVINYTRDLVDKIVVLTEKSVNTKYKTGEAFADARCLISAYIVPVIIEYNLDISQPLSDAIITCWNKKYPKNKLGKSTFKSINDGFTRKLCYITTAICQNTEKPDNCMELTTLRGYRDNWLVHQPDGEVLIKEYYMYAPMIVKCIDRLEDRNDIYEHLLVKYIEPCIDEIHAGNYEKCKFKYIDMVHEMEQYL